VWWGKNTFSSFFSEVVYIDSVNDASGFWSWAPLFCGWWCALNVWKHVDSVHEFIWSFVVQESTIGAAFFSQTLAVNDATVKFEIWDTAGQERYHSLAPMYYRGAAAAIIVYDITSSVWYLCLCIFLNTYFVGQSLPVFDL